VIDKGRENDILFPTESRNITQVFGGNAAVYAQFGFPGHNGIDFVGDMGEPIHAVEDGILSIPVQETSGYGIYCTVLHTTIKDVALMRLGKITSYYCHLSAIYYRNLTKVKRGDVIGGMGSSGFSTGVHLHFGLRHKPYLNSDRYKGYFNPMPYLGEGAGNNCIEADGKGGIIASKESSYYELPGKVSGGGAATVIESVMNIRTGPSTLGNILGVLYGGTMLKYEALLTFDDGNIWMQFANELYVAVRYEGINYVRLDDV